MSRFSAKQTDLSLHGAFKTRHFTSSLMPSQAMYHNQAFYHDMEWIANNNTHSNIVQAPIMVVGDWIRRLVLSKVRQEFATFTTL